jgi:hypothetical protein
MITEMGRRAVVQPILITDGWSVIRADAEVRGNCIFLDFSGTRFRR